MGFEIITNDKNMSFNKSVVTISSSGGDFPLDLGFDFSLVVQYDEVSKKCIILNQSGTDNFLFKGSPLPDRLDVDKLCKIMVKGSSDKFITIKLTDAPVKVVSDKITEQDIENLYGKGVNADLKLKLEKRKGEIEEARVAITKQVSYFASDLKRKLSANFKAGIVAHIALLLASMLLAFGVSNYLTGLPLKDAGNLINMPINLKLLFIVTFIIFGVGLVLKQAVYLSLQEVSSEESHGGAVKVLFPCAVLLFGGIYIVNLLYYIAPGGTMRFFAIFISLLFTLIAALLAYNAGYLRNANSILRKELNKYEYREDFELVIKEYRQWIERYINNFTQNKIKNLQDKQFFLQLKSLGEIALGVLTAPFLAYGVSNTLAMCFPEAAGWIRVSGLRFSPVFLVLATFMIIFAFFAFVGGFVANKKMQASDVLKNDGFSNPIEHGVEIYGISGMEKLNRDMRRSFIIGLCIIIIEFTMNASYFMGEMGGDLKGTIVSTLAALVPTALLIAETYMLSGTKFEVDVISDLLSKRE